MTEEEFKLWEFCHPEVRRAIQRGEALEKNMPFMLGCIIASIILVVVATFAHLEG